MKLKLSLFIFMISTIALFAQRGEQRGSGEGRRDELVTVTGIIVDGEEITPMAGAHISLTHIRDTSLTYHAATNMRGEFSMTVQRGRYTLRVTFIGYQPVVLDEPVSASEAENHVGVIPMLEGTMLDEIEVKAYRPAAIMRGDTLDYDARAFRVAPDASTEDLIRRMAGITVEDGKVTAHGEDVRRVLVDGREFFGDDPSIALRNLPAEIVERIEVYDRMSDQAELTGFDDGQRSKTINIVTRLDARSSQFGRIYSGYGGDDRYQAGLTTNIFNQSSRISIIGMTNNINEQSFSRDDIMTLTAGAVRGGRGGGGGTGGMRGGMPGGGGSPDMAGIQHIRDFTPANRYGDNTTHALGLNYSNVWFDERMNFTGSYFFNISDNYTDQVTDRHYLLDEATNRLYEEESESSSKTGNHRFNTRITFDIDENNSFIFTPRATIQNNTSDNYVNAANLLGLNNPLSLTETLYNSDLDGYNLSSSLIYRHRFSETGRTLSANIGANFNNNESLYYLDAVNEYFSEEGDGTTDETVISEYLTQKSDSETINNTLSSNITYTEPLGDNGLLQAGYNISRSANETDRITRSWEEATQSYTFIENGLSNSLESRYLTQKGTLGYRLRGDNFNMTLELGYQHAQLKAGQQLPYEHELDRVFKNFMPGVMLRYNMEDGKSLRMNYRTFTSAPSVNQLQDVVDNSNPVLLSSGNPDLDHSYSHFLMTRYNSVNTEKSTNFFAAVFSNFSSNYIGNSTIIARQDTTLASGYELPKGSQFTRPVNLDGYANIRSHINYGFPLRFIKSNLNLSAGAGYILTPSLLNGNKNTASTYSLSGGVVLTSNISENIDFTLSYNGSYNIVENKIQPQLDNDYLYQTAGTRFSFIFLEKWVFRNDLSYMMYAGLGDDFNQDYLLWNMNIGRKFLSNNQGEITLSVFDLLAQNDNIVRNVSDSYVEDLRTNDISRFFMLTFTYNLRNFNLQQ